MPNRFKRPPGPTEMIPDYVNAHYDTIGPKTFDRPVMLSFGCEKHPAQGDHAVFDVMVTWAQIEELEAAIERVRKQCAYESAWRRWRQKRGRANDESICSRTVCRR